MKKVAICSSSDKKRLSSELKKSGFRIVEKNPDWVLCYGGDGTILYAERKFPGIPKLAVKNTKICHRCEIKSNGLKTPAESIKSHNYTIMKEMKLEANVGGKKLVALNEIQIHNTLPTRAIRFSFQVNEKKFDDLIGDGVIIATPYGSSAYYQSTGGIPFDAGIGISFNNLFMKKVASFITDDKSVIKIKVVRGPALLIADNNEKFVGLKDGDVVEVRKCEEKAQFIKIY